MTVKEIRQLTNLSQQKFCENYNIPLPTLRKWEQGNREPPGYVLELLEFKVREDLKMENISPEEFYQKMLGIKELEGYDKEYKHIEMDYLMCEVLKILGYEKGVSVFNNTDKWYS